MARWITIIKTPFDHRWPSGAITHYTKTGEFLVKDEVAERAVARGYAFEGKASDIRSSKTAGAGRVRRARKEPAAAKTANIGGTAGVAAAHLPDDDRPAYGRGLDPAAG